MSAAALPDRSSAVVVVGGGSAGFAAAVAAVQAGAPSVAIIEKGSESQVGGNARYSHTGFRFVHSGLDEIREFIPDVADEDLARMRVRAYTREDYRQDLSRVTLNRIDPSLAAVLVDGSNDALHWLLGLGIKWEAHGGVEIDGLRYFEAGAMLCPQGGGLGQIARWQELAKELDIPVHYDSRVCRIYGNDRAVTGIRVSAPGGEYDFMADAVILSSGGYQASAEKRARYLGPNADLMKVRGSRHNTGEVLEMALALGAAAAGQWHGAHATPVDRNASEVESSNRANRYSYPYGITVNSQGLRFFDEGEDELAYTYAKTGWAVLEQPGGVAYQIFDQKSIKLLNKRYVHGEPISAASVAELARNLGIEPAVLTRTVDEFNAAVPEGVAFDPTKPDGRRTSGLSLDKTNWALRIDEPPYVSYPVTAGITFSFGGLEVDRSAQVLSTAGVPIRGLYATGDILGLFYHNYPSCSGQTRNTVFGRLASGRAVEQLTTKSIIV